MCIWDKVRRDDTLPSAPSFLKNSGSATAATAAATRTKNNYTVTNGNDDN